MKMHVFPFLFDNMLIESALLYDVTICVRMIHPLDLFSPTILLHILCLCFRCNRRCSGRTATTVFVADVESAIL